MKPYAKCSSKAKEKVDEQLKCEGHIEIYKLGGLNQYIYICHDCKTIWLKKDDIGDYSKADPHDYGYFLLKYQLVYVGKIYKDYGIERKRKVAKKSPCCVGGVIEVLEAKNKDTGYKKKLYRCSICQNTWEESEDIDKPYKEKTYIQTVREYCLIKECGIELVDLYVEPKKDNKKE